MKYSKHLATILGILFLIYLILMADKYSDNPQVNGQEKAITEKGKDTLINTKK